MQSSRGASRQRALSRLGGRGWPVPGLLAACSLALCAAPREAFSFAAPFETEGIFTTDEPGQAALRAVTTYADQKGDRVITIPRLEGFYRFTDDMELGVAIPFQRGTVSGIGTDHTLGSAALEFDWRLFKPDQTSPFPTIGAAPEIAFPSAAPRYGIGTGYLHAYLPLIFQEHVGNWSLVQNAAFGINPGRGNRNYVFVGATASRPITKSLSLGAELFYQSPTSEGLKHQVSFNVGGKYAVGHNQALYFSAGRGIINGENANRLSTYVGYQISF